MSWLADASANRIVKSYIKDFVDISGNFKVRNEVSTGGGGGGPSSWSAYGQQVSGQQQNEHFGYTVGLNEDGTVMAVGASYLSPTNASTSVFHYNNVTDTWVEANISADKSHAVRLNNAGTRLLQNKQRSNFNIYDYNSGTNTWNAIVGNTSSTIYRVEHGSTMSKDGSTYAFGYYNVVTIFRMNEVNQTLITIGSLTMPSNSTAMELSEDGNRIIIGSYQETANNSSQAGTARVYDYSGSGTSWSQVGSTINGVNMNDRLGYSVSMSADGNTIAVGTIQLDIAYIYEYTGGTWTLKGSSINGSAQPDSSDIGAFASSVRLSKDGNIIAIGDYTYNANQGAAFAFEYTNGDWVKKGETITAESDEYYRNFTDLVGSLALSGDGTVIAGGSRYATSSNIGSAGAAWAFKSSSSAPSIVIESKEIVDISGGTVSMLNNTMDISSSIVDISGTTWINRGQSGNSVASEYQGSMIVESNKTSSSDAVIHIETAGQTNAFSVRANGDLYSANALRHSSDDRRKINEQYITNATDTIMKLSPQIYTKLNNFEENQGTPTKIESGLIAQEIYYNAPELRHLVNIDNRDWYGNKIMPVEYDLSENSVMITDLNQSTIAELENRRAMLIMEDLYDENFWREINKLLTPLDVSVNSIQNSSDVSGNDIQNDVDYTSLGWGNKSATVDYTGLIPYLIKSNQEQQAMIDNKKQTQLDQKKTLEEDVSARIASLESK